METIEQYLARGGRIQSVPAAPTPKSTWIRDFARESAMHRMGGVTPECFAPMARKLGKGA